MNLLMQWTESVLVREMNDDGTPATKDCRETSVRYLAGSGMTDASGNWAMNVADAACEQVGLVGGVSFVATATFNPIIDVVQPPAFVMTAETHSGGYLTLYVRSFDCKCEARGNVSFDYHVAISYDFVLAEKQPTE